MTKKIAIDPFSEILDKNYKKGNKKISKSKGVKSKTDLVMTNYANSLSEYFKKISKMDQSSYEKLIERRINAFMHIYEKVSNMAIKHMTSSDRTSYDEVSMLTSFPEAVHDGSFTGKISPSTWKSMSRPKTLERLFVLEILNRFEYLLTWKLVELNLQPLTRIEKIINFRFGSDLNWAIAMAILAIHENLIKKKLIELQVNENIIQQVEKEKKFSGLVDLLRKKLEENNKKNVSLFFHKSSTLREIRNKLEHHGYKQTVSNEEVLELLNDLEKFEMVLFKKLFKSGDRVIVIDDNKEIIGIVKDILSSENVEVVAVGHNGGDAMRLYKKFKPDILVLDLLMPNKDGYSAIDEIFKINPNAKIIVMTMAHVKPIIPELLKKGVVAVIQKPFSIKSFLEGDAT